MTTVSGMMTAYVNTTSIKRMLTDLILLASPHDITTILALGLDNESKFNFVNTPGRSYEWLEDTFNPVTDVSGNEFAASTSATALTVDTPTIYQAGDVILIDTEQMWVSAVGAAQLTVVRGFGGTTAATHANDSVITIVGMARLEGAAAGDSPSSVQTSTTNYSTILQKTVNVSRTDKLVPRYGMAGLKEYYIEKNMKELLQRLNKMPYYGKAAVGSASAARCSGGIKSFLTTNVTAAAGAALTRKMIDDALVTAWAAGGNPRLILTSSWAKRKINSFYEGFVHTERAENIGGINIATLEHPLGGEPIQVVVDRSCPANEMNILDPDHVGYITIDPFFYEDLAKVGDSESGETVGEYGFVLRFEKAHALISGFSLTA